jgi:hypothetical protein
MVVIKPVVTALLPADPGPAPAVSPFRNRDDWSEEHARKSPVVANPKITTFRICRK